jgi:hypothetical protein
MVMGAPAGCGYLIPKLAMPFITLSMHLRIRESFSSRFTALLLTLKQKNSSRIKGHIAFDVNKHFLQLEPQFSE